MEKNKSFKQLICDRFLIYKNKTALKYENKQVTYAELLQKAENIAARLKKSGYERVAICVADKMNTLMLAVGCIFAGIPFLVIDKNNPGNFLKSILKEAGINTVLLEEGVAIEDVECVRVEEWCNSEVMENSGEDSGCQKCVDDPVIFYIATSGSTGKPKVAERFLSAFWSDYTEFESKVPYLFHQVAQQYAKLNFSYGLENSLLLLIGGTTVCLGGNNTGIQDMEKMYAEIKENSATVVFWATPIIKLLSKHHKLCDNMPDCIKYIYTGGEPLVISADLVVELHNRNITLINDYGCSEIGKVFTYPYDIKLRDMQAFNMIGIGKPLKGYEAKILNEQQEEAEEGYLYLKSEKKFPCSYVNKTIPTAETKQGEVWLYNTHDIARKENGEIIILGRESNSVNVSGYRVELEQVEYAVNQIREVELCVVIPFYNQYREVSLYCFYTGVIHNQQIRARLKESIPDYMIPTAFVLVDKVYLLPNGKVDRKKNSEVFKNTMQNEDVDAHGVKERVYQHLIRIVGKEIGSLNDIYLSPFSDYGMDSLSVVDFISTVEEKENVMILGDGVGSKFKCIKDIIDLINDCKREEELL